MADIRFTTQIALRASFWRDHPRLDRRPGAQNQQPTDTRVAWCDWIDARRRDGEVSDALAQRATL